MLDYNELYEYLRKEKYSEPLQALPKTFVSDVAAFLQLQRGQLGGLNDLFRMTCSRLRSSLRMRFLFFAS